LKIKGLQALFGHQFLLFQWITYNNRTYRRLCFRNFGELKSIRRPAFIGIAAKSALRFRAGNRKLIARCLFSVPQTTEIGPPRHFWPYR
jgi:hypothetical protein